MKPWVFNNFVGGRVALGLLVLRVVAGAAFILHGWPKIQQPFNWMGDAFPGWLQALAALAEFGGGVAWILGFLTPLASLGILCNMATAVHLHAVVKGDPFVGKGASYELALVYLCLSVLFLLAGPGNLSLDRIVFGKSKEAAK
jgi:putative oxidoreductase